MSSNLEDRMKNLEGKLHTIETVKALLIPILLALIATYMQWSTNRNASELSQTLKDRETEAAKQLADQDENLKKALADQEQKLSRELAVQQDKRTAEQVKIDRAVLAASLMPQLTGETVLGRHVAIDIINYAGGTLSEQVLVAIAANNEVATETRAYAAARRGNFRCEFALSGTQTVQEGGHVKLKLSAKGCDLKGDSIIEVLGQVTPVGCRGEKAGFGNVGFDLSSDGKKVPVSRELSSGSAIFSSDDSNAGFILSQKLTLETSPTSMSIDNVRCEFQGPCGHADYNGTRDCRFDKLRIRLRGG